MEPWYNMNKIEQVIGRAVRNKSHCRLPFRERNVEIFLHTTVLPSSEIKEAVDTTKESGGIQKVEEAVDTFMYRYYAEKKAIQNGKITRLLKEVSIDCLLNLGQMNNTVEKLKTVESNGNIKIHLSSSMTESELTPFDVGDKPFTEMCDYDSVCEYTNKSPPVESNVTTGTYSSRFIYNVETVLLPKLKAMFRENSFLSHDDILYKLGLKKIYPVEQIYSALSLLVNDSDNYIVDRYGRIGNVVNYENSYFFQPVELLDEHVSLFERMIPIEYKTSSVMIDIPNKREKAREEAPLKTSQEILQGLSMVVQYAKNKDALWSGDSSWKLLQEWCLSLRKTMPVIDKFIIMGLIHMDQIDTIIAHHYFDTLTYIERLTLLQFSVTSHTTVLESYYKERRLISGDTESIYCLYNHREGKNIYHRYYHATGEWDTVEREDSSLSAFFEDEAYFTGITRKLFAIFGFMWRNQKDTGWVFKVKDKKSEGERNPAKTGSECRSGVLNRFLRYENVPKLIQNVASLDNRGSMGNSEICCLTEIALRCMNSDDPDHIYFLTSEMFAILYSNI
jgi:hypothetical protein